MKLKVTKDRVSIDENDIVLSGSYNVTELEFEFTSDYNGLVKKAIFTTENVSYAISIVENKATIPGEILREPTDLSIGVYAYEVQDSKIKLRYSPSPVHMRINLGSYNECIDNSTPPTASIWEELEQKTQDNINAIDKNKEDIKSNLNEIDLIKEEQKTQNNAIDKNKEDIKSNLNEIDLIKEEQKTQNNAIDKNKEDIKSINDNLVNYSLVTETGSIVILNMDPKTYVMTLELKDADNNVLSRASLDLPLETMVVDGRYDNKTKEVILTLQSGSTIKFSIADLIDGLVNETDYNKQVETFNNSIKTINSNIEALQNDTNNLKTSKQDKLTAGDNITISNNKISAVDTTYEAGTNLKLDGTTFSTDGVYNEDEVNTLLSEKQSEIDRLNGITNALPTQSASGSNIQMTGLANAPLKDIKIYGDCYQDTSNKIYKCDGTEIGVYDFTYDSKIYEFTMPVITSDSVLVFNTNDLTLKLDDTTIETQVVDTTSGTSIELEDTPNPYYPVEIKTVTGDNEVKICGKNLLNLTNENIIKNGINCSINNDGLITINGICNESFGIYNKINLNLKAGTYIISLDDIPPEHIYFSLDNKEMTMINHNMRGKKFYIESETKFINFLIWIDKDTQINNTYKVQIEQSDTATDYEPYKGSTNTLSLGDLELCGIGDYKDYIYFKDNKWWVHKEIKSEIFNSYSQKNQNSTDKTGVFFTKRFSKKTINAIGNATMYEINNFQKGSGSMAQVVGQNKYYAWLDNYSLYNTLPGITTLEEANNWIQEHPETIYYILNTPTEEEITDVTLISQLNNLRNATMYDGETNIITSGGLEFSVDIEAFKKIGE